MGIRDKPIAPCSPWQFHKPTTATFSFETGHITFKSINWGRADEQLSSGVHYRKDDIIRVAQQLLSKLPR
jgi:hypothetical protein